MYHGPQGAWGAARRYICLSFLTAALQQWYKRRKPDVDCYVGHKFEDPVEHDENCPCTDSDYEWYVTLKLFLSHSLIAGICTAITTLSATTTNVYLSVLSPSRPECARGILSRRIWVLQAIGLSLATLAI